MPIPNTFPAGCARAASCHAADERWRSFPNFYFDVGKRPTWRHLLIRDDPAGAFEPCNAGLRRGIDGRDRRPGPGCGMA